MSTRLVHQHPFAASIAHDDAEARSPPDLLAVHDAYLNFVWLTLQRLGIDLADAQDATQDVFLVVHQRLHTYDSAQPIQGWLFGICRKVAASYRKRAHRRRELMCEHLPEFLDDALNPEEEFARCQGRYRIHTLLDKLDDEKRVVLVMFEIENIPCEEIAATLAIPIGTVYSRLHLARKALRAAFERLKA